ncbi:tRNA lysidine(34) synthetase TilS [Desulfuribacillus stibiiarsenatis]|uniref:tRNA(Ile)-lysidine synthase n=1 Tax=Desulfuribacillus stibiiarsenatis TaxID=1390249 RepID=A0A1E5L2L1_9FIRM|nr:tRNA lysidine(34) synthetase TilS [Desulfuribacillus stibiiarsenatis]OEH84356.1 tRNA lysidine(34) synthetase TilS [Desulfuribacillus stibiiarsenatis]
MANPLPITIRNNVLELANQAVVVGVSGGPDSMALLDVLQSLKEELNIHSIVAHLEHGFRGQESIEDAKYVEQYCLKYGLTFEMKSVNMPFLIEQRKGSSQEESRRERYQWFREIAKKYHAKYVLLGHHADDQVETVLMRLLQGTSLDGLSGMAVKRHWNGLTIVRPMLFVSKEDIEAYCKEQGIQPRRDPSNATNKYLRNKVRNHLIPLLEQEYNPKVKDAILNLVELGKEENDYMQTLALNSLKGLLEEEKQGKFYKVNRNGLINVPLPLQRRVILLILYYLQKSTRFEKRHVDILLRWIATPESGGILQLPGTVKVIREAEAIIFTTYVHSKPGIGAIEASTDSQVVLPSGSRIEFHVFDYETARRIKPTRNLVLFDWEMLKEKRLTVRSRIDGDRMSIWGMEGSKKVKDILIDAKVPAHQRESIPLIVSEEEIIWAAGVRRSSKAPVTDDTKNVLCIQYIE